MASDWYFKQGDQERGPFTFRDLVEMVREEKLSPETPVRPHYLDEWQRADAIVGLFHMARRDPATLPPVESLISESADEADLDSFLADSSETETTLPDQDAEKPGWLRRLLSLRSSKIPPVQVDAHPVDAHQEIDVDLSLPVAESSAPDSDFQTDSLLEEIPLDELSVAGTAGDPNDDDVSTGAYSDETWASTVNAAVERVDARAPKQEELPPPRQLVPAGSLSFLESPIFRKLMFACAMILCASAGIYGFVSWMGQGKLYFPLIGETSPLLFLVYSAGCFLIIAILGPLFAYIASPYLRFGYKLGAAVVTASLTVLYLLNWSEQQSMIFPSRKPTEAKLVFPIMGECSEFGYWMYFVDVVIFVAVLTYFAAWWLESHADEV
ncbi:DUF4339 domain-containing protein [Gimesia fumaroli]|uniref:GYF domain-containing protein n=1 Tax=Gimesia fumaroli TaxID=2527976 RepID=A0A518IBK6_9PLAN|nr:DUF4339 domain-containing protein [Gimesia fumaroli]QDV50452.1 hypothetical protein Enr17x_24920 [Gimesia fumaroli]